jgi:transcriptional regulator with GAF, ATPase, and Fis domain
MLSEMTGKTNKGRKKSLLSRTGDEAKHAAERALLLSTLETKGWNLTHTAEALEMTGPSQVLRAIKDLGLYDAYDAARKAL